MLDNLAGQTLDRYMLLRRLGEDSWGVIYKAHDPSLERDVAIRLIHPNLAGKPGFADQFIDAARLAARLDHPNVVQVFDFGEARGLRYLVREYLPGESLARLLDGMRKEGSWIPLTEAVQLVRQIAQAVEYLRGQGIPVGAVQPSEIFIKPFHSEGLPYMPVLAGAWLVGLGPAALQPAGDPSFLSPEESLGRPTDTRSEVYSLGIMLFELCTGQLPFPIHTLEDAARYHVRQPVPPPRSIRPDLPEELERVINTALEKNPAGRYTNPAALAQALEGILPQAARVTGPPPVLERAVSLLIPYQDSLDEPLPSGFEDTIPPTVAVQVPPQEQREAVEMWMESPQLSVEPGSSVSTVVSLRNTGTVEGNFRITIEGVPTEWVSLTTPDVRLMPGEQKGVNLTIQPPRTPNSRAGRYPITFRVADRRNPGWTAAVRGTLTMAVYYEFASRLYTPRLAAGETGQVVINNHGNTQETFTLFVRDANGELVFSPPQAQLRLSEGQAGALDFRVDPAQMRWIGSERVHPFSAQVVSSVGETQTHTGEFVSRAVLPVWVVGIFLVMLLCSAGFLTLLLSRSGAQTSSETATAMAQGTGIALGLTATAESTAATAQFLANANQATLQAVTATAAWQAADNDQDGLTNGREQELGTRFDHPDTDSDKLGDGDELNRKTDPLRPDTDGDRIGDGDEVIANLDPLNPDTDRDGLSDSQDPNPLQTSTPTSNLAATNAAVATANAATQAAIAQTASAGQAAQTAAAATAAAQAAQTAAAATAFANSAAATIAAATNAAAASTAAAGTAIAGTAAAATLTAQAGAITPATPSVRPVVFVAMTTTTESAEFEAFLDANSYDCIVLLQNQIPGFNFSTYEAVIIGPDTIWDEDPVTDETPQINALLASNLPILTMGEAGATFLDRAGQAIGRANGEVTEGTDILALNLDNQVWKTPNTIQIPAGNRLTLYSVPVTFVAVNVPAGVQTTQFGQHPDNLARFSIIRQDRFMLWGFSGWRSGMTATGQALFVNLLHSLLP